MIKKIIPIRFVSLFACLLAAAPLSVQAATPAGFPASGELRYDVMHGENGMRLGEAVHRWRYEDGRYSLRLALQTAGWIDMIYHFSYTQSSEGIRSEKGLQPLRFMVEQSGKKKQQAVFDPKAGSVAVTRKGKTEQYSLRGGGQDVLSVWHLVAQHANAPLPEKIDVATNRRVYPVSIRELGEEGVRLSDRRQQARRVQMKADNGKLKLDLWLAEALCWLPVRILIEDDKGTVFDQKLSAVDLAAPAAGEAAACSNAAWQGAAGS